MEKSGYENTQGWVIDTQHWVDGWRRMYPHKPARQVAADLKIPVRTVEKWFSGEARPSFEQFGPILNRYGIAFVVSGMARPAPWLDDIAREERKRQLLAERQAIDAMLTEDWQRRRARS